jgi:hypothetical protein
MNVPINRETILPIPHSSLEAESGYFRAVSMKKRAIPPGRGAVRLARVCPIRKKGREVRVETGMELDGEAMNSGEEKKHTKKYSVCHEVKAYLRSRPPIWPSGKEKAG